MNTSPVAASLPPCPVRDSRAGTRWPALAFAWCAETAPSVDFSAARGSRPFVLDLDDPGARPRPLRLARASGLSLSTPSVRGRWSLPLRRPTGAQTFASFSGATRRKAPIRLRGGTPPKCPYASCSVAPRSGVDALDLGPRSLAFLWRLSQPPYAAGPGVELRTSSVHPGGPGRQFLSAQGYLSSACGFRQPLSPSVGAGGGLAFLLAQSPCEGVQTTLAVQRAGSTVVLGARPAGSLALGAAFDDARVFWLRGAAPLRGEELGAGARPVIPCARPGAECRLVVSRALPLRAASGRRH